MNEILRALFLLVTIVAIDVFFMCLLNIKFGKALPLSFIGITFLQFIATLIGKLSYIKYIVLVFYLILIIILLKKSKYKLCVELSSPSCIVFVLIFIYCYFLLRNGTYSNIDELHYYGPIVRDCIINNTLYTNTGFQSISLKYPPFLILLEITFNKFLGGNYDGYSIFALASFSISFFIALFDKYKWKDIKKILLTLFSIICILLCVQLVSNRQEIFILNTIYEDWIISITLAYLMYSIYKFDYSRSEYICLSLTSIAFLEYKPIALPLYLMALAYILTKTLYEHKEKKYLLYAVILLIIIPFVFVELRTLYRGQFSITSSIKAIDINAAIESQSLINNIDSILPRFIQALFTTPIIRRPINLSYFMIITIEVVTILVFSIKKDKKLLMLLLFFILGSLGYAFCVYWTMEYSFMNYERISLVQFDRYMQGYSYFGMILIFYIVNEKIIKRGVEQILLIICLCLFVEPKSIDTLNVNRKWYRKIERTNMKDWLNFIYFPLKENNKIVMISQNDAEYIYLMRYMLYDQANNLSSLYIGVNKTKEEVVKKLKKYDYLYIGDYDNNVERIWNEITKEPLYNSTVYSIKQTEDGIAIKLEEIFEDKVERAN